MIYLYILLVFVIGEIVSFFVFLLVKKTVGPSKNKKLFDISTLKGTIERAVLFTGLLYNFPQILIAFGALKVATRLHDEKNIEISNNYFLIGNLSSVLIAMLDVIITKSLWTY